VARPEGEHAFHHLERIPIEVAGVATFEIRLLAEHARELERVDAAA